MVYLDDILVFSASEQEHDRHLRWVFKTLRDHKLFLKRKKCTFARPTVQYLGHIVGSGCLKVDPDKVAPVDSWDPPKDVKSLQQFLGFCNYYHKFVPRFAHLSAPLSRLLGKNVPFVWGTPQQSAFEALKAALTGTPVLALPDFARPFIVTTDASDVAIGGTLS